MLNVFQPTLEAASTAPPAPAPLASTRDGR
jgi:hypothetical protein